MTKYFAYQIEMGNLKYATVVAKFPNYKETIDKVLSEMGWMIDNNGNCVAKEVSANS